jgi:hypothetical protein
MHRQLTTAMHDTTRFCDLARIAARVDCDNTVAADKSSISLVVCGMYRACQ